eukprot:GDKJ01020214.1.p1 GENE.GDKJ01020214.1~~GDKJ01020214.1.p1  ORF type:complete len:1406 (-),score=402.84 GDKJ01020214.1:68-4285(-)
MNSNPFEYSRRLSEPSGNHLSSQGARLSDLNRDRRLDHTVNYSVSNSDYKTPELSKASQSLPERRNAFDGFNIPADSSTKRYGFSTTRLAKAGLAQATPTYDSSANLNLASSLNYSGLNISGSSTFTRTNCNTPPTIPNLPQPSSSGISNHRNGFGPSISKVPPPPSNNISSTTKRRSSVTPSQKNPISSALNKDFASLKSKTPADVAHITSAAAKGEFNKNTLLTQNTAATKFKVDSLSNSANKPSLKREVPPAASVSSHDFTEVFEDLIKFFIHDVQKLQGASYVSKQLRIRKLGANLESLAGGSHTLIVRLASNVTDPSIYPFASTPAVQEFLTPLSKQSSSRLNPCVQAWIRVAQTLHPFSENSSPAATQGVIAMILSRIEEAVNLHPPLSDSSSSNDSKSEVPASPPAVVLDPTPAFATLGVIRWVMGAALRDDKEKQVALDSLVPSAEILTEMRSFFGKLTDSAVEAVGPFGKLLADDHTAENKATSKEKEKRVVFEKLASNSGMYKSYAKFVSSAASDVRQYLEELNQKHFRKLESDRIAAILKESIPLGDESGSSFSSAAESALSFESKVERLGIEDVADGKLVTDRLIGLGSHLHVMGNKQGHGFSHHSANILGMLGWDEGINDPLNQKFLDLLPELPLSSGFARALLDKFLITLTDKRVRCSDEQRRGVSILMRRLLGIAEARETCGNLKDLNGLVKSAINRAKKSRRSNNRAVRKEKQQRKKDDRILKNITIRERNAQKRELRMLQQEERALERLIKAEKRQMNHEKRMNKCLRREISQASNSFEEDEKDKHMRDFLKKCGSSWNPSSSHAHDDHLSSSHFSSSSSEGCVVEDAISSTESELSEGEISVKALKSKIRKSYTKIDDSKNTSLNKGAVVEEKEESSSSSEGEVNSLSSEDENGDGHLKDLLKGLGGGEGDSTTLLNGCELDDLDSLLADEKIAKKIKVSDVLDALLDKALKCLSTDGLHALSYLMMSFVSFSERLGIEVDKTFKHLDLNVALAFFGLTELPKSKKELRRKYLELSIKLHPDKNGGTEFAHADFQLLQQYKTLLEEKIDQAEANSAFNQEDEEDFSSSVSGLSKFNDHLSRCSDSMQQGFVFDVQKDRGVLDAFVKLAEQSEAPKEVLMMLLLTTRVDENDGKNGKEEGEVSDEEDATEKANREAEEVHRKTEAARREEEERLKKQAATEEAGEREKEEEEEPLKRTKAPPVTTREKVVHAIHTALPTCTASVGSLQQRLAERQVEIMQSMSRRVLDCAGDVASRTVANLVSSITESSPTPPDSKTRAARACLILSSLTFASQLSFVRAATPPTKKSASLESSASVEGVSVFMSALRVGLLQGMRMTPCDAKNWLEENLATPLIKFVESGNGEEKIESARSIKRMVGGLIANLTPLD